MPPMSEVQALFSILRQSADPLVADAIQRLVETGADRELNRVNVLDFSKKTGLPEPVVRRVLDRIEGMAFKRAAKPSFGGVFAQEG